MVSLVIIKRTHKTDFFLFMQMILGLMAPFFHNLLLGGFMASGAVILWSLMSPLGALFYLERKKAWPWWGAFVTLLIVAALLEFSIRGTNNLPESLVITFFVMNITTVTGIVILMLNYFVQQKNKAYRLLAAEQDKSETLLLNILPKEIAAKLKQRNQTIAEYYPSASILFADMVGFTTISAKIGPTEMVDLLNHIYSHFDSLVDLFQVEKIRTIGDNYMVVAGVPVQMDRHAQALAGLAIEMQDFLGKLPKVDGNTVNFRIGINSGPVVGGVIGKKKFVFDVWGDAVNIASRMESQGEAGRIQITQMTYDLIREEFSAIPRGFIDIKGSGVLKTWFLTGKNNMAT